jgi:Flp pilus assembly protein TadG
MKTSPLRRRHLRSQSIVEFALILPMFMALVMGLVDFGFMISNSNRLALVVREGANIIARTSFANKEDIAFSSMIQAAQPELDLSERGGMIITYMAKASTDYNQTVSCVLVSGVPKVFSQGNLFGTGGSGQISLKNKSRLLDRLDPTNFVSVSARWEATKRTTAVDITDFAVNAEINAVEGFVTNRFITPIGDLLSYGGNGNPFQPPPFLYDSAFF